MADIVSFALNIVADAETIKADKSQPNANSCPEYGSNKLSCLATTLQSCTQPCQAVVFALNNVTDDAAVATSQALYNPTSTLNTICGLQFSNMDACLHCSLNGFGLNSHGLVGLLLPWSVACSTWMDYGPARAYECWQGYASNNTAACDGEILKQVAASKGHRTAPTLSVVLAGLSVVAFLGLSL